ncbi:MAG: methyltransferase domain-containing protein, partial [Lachnospiraceae bacterium]|nr:methyltransferase domain-containing protein [Lachnospiraceae bacterium]
PYGNKVADGTLKLFAVDPLAYFYNKINEKSVKAEKGQVQFGLLEFLSAFYQKNSVDVIIVDNAMDHCIDPFKSILECLAVIRAGGILTMKHRRCEAVYEGYTGLHKWNMDVNDDNEFIIWNKENLINVNRSIADFAEMNVYLRKSDKRKDEFIEIEIEKKRMFDIDYFYNTEEEHQRMGKIIQLIMMKLSDPHMNSQFQKLLEIL